MKAQMTLEARDASDMTTNTNDVTIAVKNLVCLHIAYPVSLCGQVL